MRLKNQLILFGLTLLLSNVSYAWGSSSCYVGCSTPCPKSPCDKYMTTCQCTDDGWRYNDCISRCKYCLAFGNVGAR